MGLPPRDFLTRYGFRRYARSERIWSLDFTFAMPLLFSALSDLGRGRQVSTLSSSRRMHSLQLRVERSLARYCSHPHVLLFHRV